MYWRVWENMVSVPRFNLIKNLNEILEFYVVMVRKQRPITMNRRISPCHTVTKLNGPGVNAPILLHGHAVPYSHSQKPSKPMLGMYPSEKASAFH